ncbi:MAG: hypothetical protein KJ767_00305 [Nanoarchaeota archaeon]|nr:hypothetical protein [Nanoarchaeota archaeon]
MVKQDWKGALPLTIFFFAVAALFFSGAPLINLETGYFFGTFLGNIILGTAWLLLIPLFSGVGVTKKVDVWFIRAGAFAFVSAAFILLSGTFIDTGSWSKWLVEVGIILSWLMAGIGSLIVLATAK